MLFYRSSISDRAEAGHVYGIPFDFDTDRYLPGPSWLGADLMWDVVWMPGRIVLS